MKVGAQAQFIVAHRPNKPSSSSNHVQHLGTDLFFLILLINDVVINLEYNCLPCIL